MTTVAAAPVGSGVARGGSARLLAGLIGGSVLVGLLAGQLMASGKGAGVVGLGVVLLPTLLWRRPWLAPAVVLFVALTIEQFPDALGLPSQQVTQGIPLFHGLGALRLNPSDLLLGSLFLLATVKLREQGRTVSLRTPTGFALGGLIVAVFVGMAMGMAHGGQMRVMFMETRPYVYLASTFILASSLLVNRQAIRAVLWAIVAAEGFKAAQGMVTFMAVRHMNPRPEAVLGHEEALFFGVFIILTTALWLFNMPGRLRTAATWLLPLVLMADLANSRRAAWLVLGGTMVTLLATVYRCLPARRLLCMRIGAGLGVFLALYIPAFWNKTGGLAQPARAIRSTVAPSTRDASSDLYRVQENENLRVNIKEGKITGRGFGVRIDYPLEIADISDIDPLIAYVPHNGVLYVLMRMGLLGGVALWSLIGVGIIGGCRLARSPDREAAMIGAVVACALFGYAMEGGVDQGFFFYRIAFVIGSLLGLAEAARRLQLRPGRAQPWR